MIEAMDEVTFEALNTPPESEGSSELVLYDEMRLSVERCAEIDEAAGIKDKAERLAAYARIRDDRQTEARFREIGLRAVQQIGKLSRDLEKAEHGGAGGGSKVSPERLSKNEQLASAGISKPTAYRYEELAGPREEQAEHAVTAATDHYFASTEAKGEVPNMKGLSKAVTDALTETLGEPERPQKADRKPDTPLSQEFKAWSDFSAWLYTTNSMKADPVLAAEGQISLLVDDSLERCNRVLQLLQQYKTRTLELYPDVRV